MNQVAPPRSFPIFYPFLLLVTLFFSLAIGSAGAMGPAVTSYPSIPLTDRPRSLSLQDGRRIFLRKEGRSWALTVRDPSKERSARYPLPDIPGIPKIALDAGATEWRPQSIKKPIPFAVVVRSGLQNDLVVIGLDPKRPGQISSSRLPDGSILGIKVAVSKVLIAFDKKPSEEMSTPLLVYAVTPDAQGKLVIEKPPEKSLATGILDDTDPRDSCAGYLPWGALTVTSQWEENPSRHLIIRFKGYCDRYLFPCSSHKRGEKDYNMQIGGPFYCDLVRSARALTVVRAEKETGRPGLLRVISVFLEDGEMDDSSRSILFLTARGLDAEAQERLNNAQTLAGAFCGRVWDCEEELKDEEIPRNFEECVGLIVGFFRRDKEVWERLLLITDPASHKNFSQCKRGIKALSCDALQTNLNVPTCRDF